MLPFKQKYSYTHLRVAGVFKRRIMKGGEMKDKKYWYLFTEYYCPACGRTDIYKERIYNKPKPKNYYARHIVIERWCYCGAL